MYREGKFVKQSDMKWNPPESQKDCGFITKHGLSNTYRKMQTRGSYLFHQQLLVSRSLGVVLIYFLFALVRLVVGRGEKAKELKKVVRNAGCKV